MREVAICTADHQTQAFIHMAVRAMLVQDNLKVLVQRMRTQATSTIERTEQRLELPVLLPIDLPQMQDYTGKSR